MTMHFQTWDNGKYGRIWAVGDDDYSWKFTEIINGCASEEDFEKSPVIASHFIGYCINNEPKGEGDIYTPFFTLYYNKRLEIFRQKHIKDISLIRDSKRLESLFLNEHFIEERQAFEDSDVLYEFDSSKENSLPLLYYAYRDFLREKMPRYFVFCEKLIPQVFPWREFDKIAMMGYAFTEVLLDKVLDFSLGRVFASDIINGRCIPEAEEVEQIKATYGDSASPCEVNYIRFNTSDKRKMAEAIYDAFLIDMEQRQFISPKEEELVMEHAKRWLEGIPKNSESKRDVKTIKRQLELCLRRIGNDNMDEHTPFFAMDYRQLDDAKLEGCDRYGYAVEHQYRLTDDEFKNMMDAFDRWALIHYGNEISNDEELIAIEPLSSDLNKHLHRMQKSMQEENIIGEILYSDFVNCIYRADFKTLYETAKANRNIKRLFLVISRIKTWFPDEWEIQAASSIGIPVKKMRNVTLSEIEQGHADWYDMLDTNFPKRNPTR